MSVNDIPVAALQRSLLRFYDVERRDLPWRRRVSPYRVWVSEIMLQQTRVETVEKRYAGFLRRFPSIKALAEATEAEICDAWAGLGYYRRARMLHAAARAIRDEHGGRFPRTLAAIRALPGVGDYTAGAIASIAFGQQAPLVDGNVIRVLTRLGGLDGDPTRNPLKSELWALASRFARHPRPGDINQGLMELGATICTKHSPACTRCPWRGECRALAEQRTDALPALPPRAKARRLEMAYAVVSNARGEILCHRRGADGLWANLLEPLSVELGQDAPREASLLQAWPCLNDAALEGVGQVEHLLTHRRVLADVFIARSWRGRRPKGTAWIDPGGAMSRMAEKVVARAIAQSE